MKLVEFLDHASELVFVNPEQVVKVARGHKEELTTIYLVGSHGTQNTHVHVLKDIHEVVELLEEN